MMHRYRRSSTRFTPIGLGVLAALALAGCGAASGASAPPHTVTQNARPTPAQSRDDTPGGVVAAASHDPLDQAHSSVVKVASAKPGFRASARDKRVAGEVAASAVNPCTLVSRHDAQAISGRRISAVTEAPLGPTCIYTVARAPALTLALQTGRVASLTRTMHGRRGVHVAGRAGYCGTIGHDVLYVQAGGANVLSIGGPCGVAQRFAAKALAKLGG